MPKRTVGWQKYEDVLEKLEEISIKLETYNDYPQSATNNAKKAIKWKEERKKTTIGDLKTLDDLKSKMDAKKQSSYYGCDHGKNGLPYYMTDVAS